MDLEIRMKPIGELERMFAPCRDVRIEDGIRIIFTGSEIVDGETQPESTWDQLLDLLEQLTLIPLRGG